MSYIVDFLDKSISIPWQGNTYKQGLLADLAGSARETSYVETIGNKADTFHKYTKQTDEISIKRSYDLVIRQIIKKLGLKKVEIALDTKKDFYYGTQGSYFSRTTKHMNRVCNVWEYVVVSIVWPITIPLMATPYYQTRDLTNSSIELLEFVRSLKFNVQLVLFDRGFHEARLIDYLEARRTKRSWNYLMFVPQDKAVKRYINQTTESFASYNHEFSYGYKKSTWKPQTTYVVCKEAGFDNNEDPYDMVFATNLKPSFSLVKRYKQRWCIETGFRVMEEGRTKTKSNHPMIRLLYFFLRMLFTTIWKLSNLTRTEFMYKTFLREVEKYLRRFEVYKPPPILPLF